MENVLTEIIKLLTGGITGMATGIGTGLQSLVSNIFLDTSGDTTKLSIYGGVICIFGGIALAVGLSRMIVQWVSSLGN
jgi:hypothetical protein